MQGAQQSAPLLGAQSTRGAGNTELALMGHQWAVDDENPLQFVHKLHVMFLAVLRAKKEKEDEAGLLFPVECRKA